jgi:hypothetical protein
MRVEDVGDEVVRFAVRLAGWAVSVPVVVGFVALGTALVLGRSVLDTARRARGLVSWGGDAQDGQRDGESKAA